MYFALLFLLSLQYNQYLKDNNMKVKIHNIMEKCEVLTMNGVVTKNKIKDSLFVDSFSIRKISKLAESEINDCVVRAFKYALDISYMDAHKYVADVFHRIPRKGTYTLKYLFKALNDHSEPYIKKLTLMGFSPSYIKKINTTNYKSTILLNKKYKKETGFTVKSFMEQHRTGSYFIVVKGHALALVDGVLYGNSDEQYKGHIRRIRYVVKCG